MSIRTASCHCGRIELRCEGEPRKISMCHCLDCQRRTGSLFSVAVFYDRERVSVARGETARFERDSASGFPVLFHFCQDCGSNILWEARRLPALIGVAAGAFADPDFPRPEQSVWQQGKHGWIALPDDMPQHAANPPGRLSIREDDLSGEQTRALLALHLAGMHANSPPENVFALDLSGLQAPGVTVWTAWEGERIAGIGALKQLDTGAGEIKSMRTHPDHLRKGVAAAMLEHIIAAARAQGLARLSLETGSGPAFDPALALYRKRGFRDGEAFADYERSAFNQFLHLELN